MYNYCTIFVQSLEIDFGFSQISVMYECLTKKKMSITDKIKNKIMCLFIVFFSYAYVQQYKRLYCWLQYNGITLRNHTNYHSAKPNKHITEKRIAYKKEKQNTTKMAFMVLKKKCLACSCYPPTLILLLKTSPNITLKPINT